jgi:hypothetical protein
MPHFPQTLTQAYPISQGGMFYDLCDEISELDWAVALQQLIELLEDTLKNWNTKAQKLTKSQLHQWIQVCLTISRLTCLFLCAKVE